ncbi:MAG TPA: PfkB family carbohydrate kinase [Anaeromyxobacter sp.]
MSPIALVVGHATLDESGGAPVPGGSAYYAALALAGLGADVRVLTRAGPDLPADFLSPAAGAGPGAGAPCGRVEALVLPCPATTRFVNVHDASGRRSQRVVAAAPPLEPEALPLAWRGPDLLLLAPVVGEADPAAFVRAVRARVVGLCVQGLVRAIRPDGAVVPRRLDPGAGALAGIDAAFLGDDEAAGQPDLVDALAAAVPIVAATHGARGSEVRARGGTLRVGVHPAREVDPTGAGDVYAAAFLLALARAGSLEEAARLGAAAASIVVEGRGGAALRRIGEAFARAAGVPVE